MPTIWGNNLVVCLINIQYMGAMTTIYVLCSVKMGQSILAVNLWPPFMIVAGCNYLKKSAMRSFSSLFKMETNIKPSSLYGSNITPEMSTFVIIFYISSHLCPSVKMFEFFFSLDGPRITLQPSLKIVKVNQTNIVIPCIGTSYPTPTVIWKKDGVIIQSPKKLTKASNDSVYQIITQSGWDNKSNVNLNVTSRLFLRPNGIKYEDHGNYICEVLNVNESSIPRSKTVEIQCK